MGMRNNKVMRIVIGGTICFLVFAFLGIQTTRAQEKVQLTGLDIALKTLYFMESVPENNDGLLIYRKVCRQEECSFSTQAFPQTRAWVVFAYTGLYEATGDTVYLDKIRESMEKLMKECEPSEFGDCRFLGVQAEAAHKALGEERYLDYIRLFEPSSMPLISSTINSMLGGIMIRQVALNYKHDLYDEFLSIYFRIKRLYETLPERETLLTDHGVDFQQTACWTYLAEIELYKAIAEKNDNEILFSDVDVAKMRLFMLLEPEYFFSQFNFENASVHPTMFGVSLTDLESCADAALKLYEVTGKEQYKKQATAILQGMVERHWDSEYSKKHIGDNAFLAQGCRNRNNQNGFACYQNDKGLTDNAYAVYLFSQVPDAVFSIATDIPVIYFEKPQVDPELTQPSKKPLLKRLYLLFIVILAGVLIFVMYRFYQKTRQNKKSDFDDRNPTIQ